MAPTLGYWDLRGLGQPIRNLLIYKGIDFEDKRYKFGSAPDYDRGDWLKEKFSLGIMDNEETTQLDVMEQQARDLAWWLVMVCYSPNFQEQRAKYEETMMGQLRLWDEHLQGKLWVLGERLTYVDFLLYEALDWNYEFKPEAFQGFPVVVAYMRRFEELPNLKEYFASDKYSKWPLMGPQVKWGHVKE
ncbi:hypothetical protein HPB52_007781 [Rhipicephalus sanguineus]|uniref:glutathione transferase n=1 Tax=Rhipicephalus sanguineus TaxID=34632 RepID=A0A9D4PUX7_RHISA|nr:hypothetical protein HPB52_007781 [Rhipicephalus sanguineus]